MKFSKGGTLDAQARPASGVLSTRKTSGKADSGAVNRSRPVHGTIHSVFTTQNCTSPVGLCTFGTITGAGPLDAATTFTALDVAQSAGLAAIEPPANLSFSGQLTIVASHGTLVTRELGVVDAAHLAFTEMERPASGTGVFTNPGGSVFFISGSIIDNGQDSRENCRAPFGMVGAMLSPDFWSTNRQQL